MGASFSNRTAAEKSLGSVLPSVCVITKRDWKGKALAWRGWLVFYSKEGRDRFIGAPLRRVFSREHFTRTDANLQR